VFFLEKKKMKEKKKIKHGFDITTTERVVWGFFVADAIGDSPLLGDHDPSLHGTR
jgi:hypothetical protein